MGGLGNLFKKVIPIVMLVCFLCLGITHIFGHFDSETGKSNITYLSQETYNIGTEENPKEITYYEIDVNSYMNGINNDFLQRSVTKVLNIEAYTSVLDEFEQIWANGYNVGDFIRTIGNALLLVVNNVILIINAILVPIRIISGLLLTAFSFVGIDMTNQGIIATSLNAIIDNAAIPYINAIFNQDSTTLDNTIWQFNRYVKHTSAVGVGTKEFEITFTIPEDSRTFNKLTYTIFSGNLQKMSYWYTENSTETEYIVYQNSAWLYGENTKIIQISSNNLSSNYKSCMNFLDKNATQLYELPISQYYNKTYTWQQTTISSINYDTTIYSEIAIESNGTDYIMYAFTHQNNETLIAYYHTDRQNYTIVYSNTNGWTNESFKNFTIKEQYLSSLQTQQLENLLRQNLIA